MLERQVRSQQEQDAVNTRRLVAGQLGVSEQDVRDADAILGRVRATAAEEEKRRENIQDMRGLLSGQLAPYALLSDAERTVLERMLAREEAALDITNETDKQTRSLVAQSNALDRILDRQRSAVELGAVEDPRQRDLLRSEQQLANDRRRIQDAFQRDALAASRRGDAGEIERLAQNLAAAQEAAQEAFRQRQEAINRRYDQQELDRVRGHQDELARLRLEGLGPVAEEGTAAFFEQRRRQLEAEHRLELDQLARRQEELGDAYAEFQMEVAARQGAELGQLRRDEQDNLRRLQEDYRQAFRSIGETIGDAFQNFRDNTEGWVNFLLSSLPNIIEQFRQLGRAADRVSLAGGQTGGSFLGNFASALFGGGRLPSFQQGGRVPGPVGSPQVILAHGGEEVIPVGGRGGDINLTINLDPGGPPVRDQLNAALPEAVAQLEMLRDWERT